MSRKIYCSAFLLLFICSSLFAQVSDTSIVLLKSIDSTIVTDVRYATANNFTGKVLYPTANVYLRKSAAEKLHEAEVELLSRYNLRLKVFDGYRPLSVQKKLWEIMPDTRYVANPKNGSRHNRGAAVDLTLIDSTGRELEMGTSYDDFTDRAHRDYEDLPENVLNNRRFLEEIMVKYGFEPLSTEWWHFDYSGWKNYSILDEEIK
ncbi:MAG: M15 family metallopeptidase [Ignavibacteria bacterium]|jgi:D-alanyl-D-alanine dipeptidase|nr:M15 family metallopeptidase [Ignavibacteria bacterium]MCU7502701.1 M15 family metallopeptidase [Ignavibacteria bacterium]MCU7517370.1 M15 family metallopeptidase [Ignavibacteria bacterium]